MRRFCTKSLFTLVALVLLLAMTVVPCFASAIELYSTTNGFDYSIPTGQKNWDGKSSDKLWNLDSANGKECSFNVSVLSTRNIMVTGVLYEIITLFPDTKVATVYVTPTNEKWWDSSLFNPETGHSYYAVITASSKDGCNGRTSITLP